MLNIFMLCRDDAAKAAQSLAALVPGVVLGHVGRAALQSPADNDDLRNLADEAGCDLVIGRNTAELFQSQRRQRPGWWLVMRAGQIPAEGWSDAAMHHIATQNRPGAMPPARGFRGMIMAHGALLLGRASTRRHMLIVPPDQSLDNQAGHLGWRGRAIRLRVGFET